MKQFTGCLVVLLLSGVFIFGQDLNSDQSSILVSPISISKLPKIVNQEIRINLDIQYLEAWGKYRHKWKRVYLFPIVVGDTSTPTPAGIFYVYHKEYQAVNSNGTSLGNALDFVMRKDGDVWLRLAIHGWIFDSAGRPGWGPTQGCVQLLRSDMEKLYRWAKKALL